MDFILSLLDGYSDEEIRFMGKSGEFKVQKETDNITKIDEFSVGGLSFRTFSLDQSTFLQNDFKMIKAPEMI
jgi:hypothetical protein